MTEKTWFFTAGMVMFVVAVVLRVKIRPYARLVSRVLYPVVRTTVERERRDRDVERMLRWVLPFSMVFIAIWLVAVVVS